MNRREFLKITLAGVAAMALGNFEVANAEKFFSDKKVDFHAHAILPSYVEGLKKNWELTRSLKKVSHCQNGQSMNT